MLIDQHGLNFQPFLPGGLGNVIENSLAFGAGEGRFIETLGFLAETLAENGMSAHRWSSLASVMEFLGGRGTGLKRQIPEEFPDRCGQVSDLVRGEEMSA